MTADRFNPRATPPPHGTERRARFPSHDAPAERVSQNAPASRNRPAVRGEVTHVQSLSVPQILIALLAAPFAWLAQVGVAQTVQDLQCVAGGPLFIAHTLAWTPHTVLVASLICLALGGYGSWVAWRNLWRTARIPWRFPSALKGTRAERDWFVSRVCAMSSTMFVLGLLATDVAMLIITPCSPW
ncbi:hypothetical protein [Paraburkholderia sp.]|jgi:hypothetical protein|uniref:hypothetical protein n=1 Tax=Paraburkholderia sp. TaxID=1926495 RepID=UPI002F409C8F